MRTFNNKSQSNNAKYSELTPTKSPTHKNSVFQDIDSRPQSAQLLALQETANNSPRNNHLRSLQKIANTCNSRLETPIQRQLTTLAPSNEVVQLYPTIDDYGRDDSVIYVIYDTATTEVLYVGQTTAAREFERFQEHTRDDGWGPWHIHATMAGIDYTLDRSTWPYDYEVVENLKNVTKFETTVAEQWWMEHHKTKGCNLLNDSTPCLLSNFNKRSIDPNLYDPKNIGVLASYKPSMTAK